MASYVGFANLPNQVHRKSVKKGFEFTLMVVGEFSGLFLSTNGFILNQQSCNDDMYELLEHVNSYIILLALNVYSFVITFSECCQLDAANYWLINC